jgi:uncharacterized protein (DUF885 family)
MLKPLVLPFIAACVLLTPIHAAVAQATPPPDAAQPGAPAVMPDLIRRYAEDESYIERFERLDWSQQRQRRLEEYYDEWLARLDGLEYRSLPTADRIDFHLLRTRLKWNKDGIALERRRLEEMSDVLPFREAIENLETARVRMENCDPMAAAAVLSGAAEKVKKTLERVKGGMKKEADRPEDAIVLSASAAARAAGVIDGLNGTIDRWQRFYDEFVPGFDWWTRRPRDKAQDQLKDLAKYLREEVAGLKGKDEDPLVGDPIGREALLADIRGEMLAYSPEELIAIGEKQLAWCEEEMKKAAADTGYPDDWKAALAKVKEAHVAPGEQASFVRDESRAMIAFLKERDLVSIPKLCEESWRVEMHSVETQKTLPYAVYGGQYMGVSFAAASMSHEDKLMSMRGNNRHFTHIVAPHELIPGHHLQGFFAQREREYRRRVFSTPFLVEGWALYWEFRFWELDWAGKTGQDEAMDRIGMLFWRSHRAARIIVSLKFHLGQMTPQEMVDFLVDRVGHERSGATAEVRRYIGGHYSPLYQCGYMIGGIQLRALHRELVESGTMTDKQFNNAVLMENSVPIEMIRASLKGVQLEKDWEPRWRFADE